MVWFGANVRRRSAPPWLALLGVLAIAIQCFVVQTHVHGAANWTAANLQAIAAAEPGDNSRGAPASPLNHDSGGDCYLCQSAVAGTAVLSSLPTLPSIQLNFIAVGAAIVRAAPLLALRSHTWRSRAPPLPL